MSRKVTEDKLRRAERTRALLHVREWEHGPCDDCDRAQRFAEREPAEPAAPEEKAHGD